MFLVVFIFHNRQKWSDFFSAFGFPARMYKCAVWINLLLIQELATQRPLSCCKLGWLERAWTCWPGLAWTRWPPSKPTQQLADAQLSLWKQQQRISASWDHLPAFESRPLYRRPVWENWCGWQSVPVPSRTEAIVGPSGRHVYSCQGAHGTSAEDQAGWVEIEKEAQRVATKDPKGCLVATNRCGLPWRCCQLTQRSVSPHTLDQLILFGNQNIP